MIRATLTALALTAPAAALAQDDGTLRGTGDLGVVIERATGSVLVVDQSDRAALCRVEGLGDLSHASLTFSPDERFAYVFGRDGGLSKVDILACTLESRVIQAGIDLLPAEQRIVLTLSDVEGLSYEEIAVVMDTSLGTVKSRLSRARAKLRDFLLEQQELLPKRYRLETDE